MDLHNGTISVLSGQDGTIFVLKFQCH
ncbi:hypothetical protein P4645_16795 [Lysinibacillus fusiformis]|nr:hypothetical protein [Lysinibacillus fusiformis]MED4077872.1 hypothetical protein [Lysinibacillus fusiformis]